MFLSIIEAKEIAILKYSSAFKEYSLFKTTLIKTVFYENMDGLNVSQNNTIYVKTPIFIWKGKIKQVLAK
jgi:hypothetical protein